MLYLKPQYHPTALAAVQKLADEGITCDLDELLWLHHEAQRATRITPGDGTMLDYPLIVGNAALWPLTLGADEWLTRYARPLYATAPTNAPTHQRTNSAPSAPSSLRLQTLCIGFAMAHSRRPEMFIQLTTRARIIWRVCYWAAGRTFTLRELAAGVDRVLGIAAADMVNIPTPKELAAAANAQTHQRTNSAPSAPAPDYSGHGDTIALLCHFYGNTPDYWLWQISSPRVLDLIERISRITGADADEGKAKALNMCRFLEVVKHIRNKKRDEG